MGGNAIVIFAQTRATAAPKSPTIFPPVLRDFEYKRFSEPSAGYYGLDA